jgi:hypothetical protein
MRPASLRLLAFSFLLIAAARPATAAPADDAKLEGTYKGVLSAPLQELELFVATFEPDHDNVKVTTKDAMQLAGGKPSVISATQKGDNVDLSVRLLGSARHFVGVMGADGKVRGSMVVQGTQPWAFRLEKARDAKVREPKMGALREAVGNAMQQRDVKKRAKALADLTKHEEVSGPHAAVVHILLLQSAGEGELSEGQVQDSVDALVALVKPYGESLLAANQAEALKMLKASKGKFEKARLALEKQYVPLEMKLATEAEKELGESASADEKSRAAARIAAIATRAGNKELAAAAEKKANDYEFEAASGAEKALPKSSPAENRVRAALRLAAIAKLVGKADVAAEAEERAAKLDKDLDEEYHKTVPPFKPEVASRKDKDSNRVVLLELFTGAQCPPCVAADVAFDALIHSYQPTDLVTLQYHLHIPGPDPLTNADSEARAEYYEIGGTPSVFFNGKAHPGGGGAMQAAKDKYDEYRSAVDDVLKGKKDGKVTLKVTRSGDDVKILASAEGPSGDKASNGDLKLRVALTEEQIKYVGGNRLRFHHHVVRGFPGGTQGKALADGKAAAELTLKLDDVRKGLETYVSDYARENNAFTSTPLPPVELKDLSVVAFLQDDKTKEVLDVVVVPVEEKK